MFPAQSASEKFNKSRNWVLRKVKLSFIFPLKYLRTRLAVSNEPTRDFQQTNLEH